MKPAVIIVFVTVFTGLLNIKTFAQELIVTYNIEQSLTKANEHNKNILMIFSGSDWCKPCIQLKKKILNSDTFISYSNSNLILLELDFPYSKMNSLSKSQQKHNEALADIYNREGSFPKLVLLDKKKNTLGTVPYRKQDNAEDLILSIQKIVSL